MLNITRTEFSINGACAYRDITREDVDGELGFRFHPSDSYKKAMLFPYPITGDADYAFHWVLMVELPEAPGSWGLAVTVRLDDFDYTVETFILRYGENFGIEYDPKMFDPTRMADAFIEE